MVPILKVDKGLAAEADGVQVMKPIGGLDALLARAVEKGIFGTKMRSVIKLADEGGVAAIVEQQFAIGAQIADAGLVPILEPEVDIHSPQKADAEKLLHAGITAHLDALPADRHVMLKLTPAQRRRLLRRPRGAPAGAARRRPLRRLQPRRRPTRSSPGSTG